MNASVKLWHEIKADPPDALPREVPRLEPIPSKAPVPDRTPAWSPSAFAENQIAALVRRVFFPGWPRPAKQVVFTAVDADHDISRLCFNVAQALSCQVSGNVCLVDADIQSTRLDSQLQDEVDAAAPGPGEYGPLHGQCISGRPNLRFLQSDDFLPTREIAFSAAWLRHRVAELRREFEYSIFHAPAAALFSETALLAHLADGVVLVLTSSRTRRAAAWHARGLLHAVDAKLIGTVLDRRRFPIPEVLYRRL